MPVKQGSGKKHRKHKTSAGKNGGAQKVRLTRVEKALIARNFFSSAQKQRRVRIARNR